MLTTSNQVNFIRKYNVIHVNIAHASAARWWLSPTLSGGSYCVGVGVSACGCVIYVVRPLRVGVAHAAASPPLQHARAGANCTRRFTRD